MSIRQSRQSIGLATVCVVLAGLCIAHAPALASHRHKPCAVLDHQCYRTIQAAVDAADDGDTIWLRRGEFRGGVTIDKSIRLIGEGARKSVIEGGGPVLTIGEFLAPAQPTVSISGVTIEDGRTTSSPQSQEFTGAENVIAVGGGIAIPPSADLGIGATVTIRDSVVTDNRVRPTATVPGGPTCPGGDRCPFALARGGGIDSAGNLTLHNTTVSDNTAAGVASDATGGGIAVVSPGSLTLTRSRVIDNSAIASRPNGRFAEGGGIFTEPGVPVTVRGGAVDDNEASLTSDLPYFVPGADPLDMLANGGGIHTGDDGAVSIDGTSLSGNTVSVNDPNGEPYAFDAALHPGVGPLDLRNSRIEDNRVIAKVASSENNGVSGSALAIYSPANVDRLVIRDNETFVFSQAGIAAANGAVYAGNTGFSEPAVITNSVIADNEARAISPEGEATVQGGGIINDGILELRDSLIVDNEATAFGPGGFAQGGGIWNGSLFNDPPIELTLERTTVVRNRLRASDGLDVQGGGLFTTVPVTLTQSPIVRNSPDQCVGC